MPRPVLPKKIIAPGRGVGLKKVFRPRAIMNEMDAAVAKLQTMNVHAPLIGQSLEELQELAASLGEPRYRGGQIYNALYAERVTQVERITALPAEMRRRIEESSRIGLPEIVKRHRSTDGTVRYVLRCAGMAGARDAVIETVFMPEEKRQTICVSTQEGCAVNCQFCLTATLGLLRNLTAGEIVGQILVALEDNRDALKPQTNVVLMGQGEPLLNYKAVMKALGIILDAKGLGISPKHATLSTSGIVPGVERLAKEKVRPKLAISLNASNDEQRDAIMPINRKYPIAKLMEACRNYPLRPWEHLTFEYVLLGGFNDSVEDARRVAKLVGNLRAKVNLIPWNPGELPYRPPDAARIEAFRKTLVEKGQRAFVRYSRGQDVMAACGQLALVESAAKA
jgi:23S rRNA (adenine2503-C2)-methyltransferase